MKKIFASPWFPLIILIITFFVAFLCKQYENTLVAAGTVGAVVTAVWAIFYRDLTEFKNRPILIMAEPAFNPPFYRKAPKKNQTDYYINILLKNTGNRTANNCQPLLIGMWKFVQNDWKKEENWISVPLQWAGGEKREYGTNKIREERNIIPYRPYYFNLGKISTNHSDELVILYLPSLAGQRPQIDAGVYCFEVTVTGEEVDLPPKFFYVIWRGGCTANLKEVEQRFEVSMKDNPPA